MSGVPQGSPVIQAYRFALDPTPAQERALRSHCGAQRVAYNWGLATVKANWEQREAELTYGIPEAARTQPLNWSAYALRKLWNPRKDEVAPWWSENSKESYASGLANLAVALANWSASKRGTRSGATVCFPRFKSKRSPLSCRFTTGGFGLAGARRRHVRLPSIGVVRTHESTRKLVRRIQRGVARLRSVTVVFRGGRWFASFSVENLRSDAPARWPDLAVGVDLGISHLAVLSRSVRGISDADGAVSNGRRLERELRTLRRLERQAGRRIGADRRTRHPGSARWRRTRARIDRLHRRAANARRNDAHKLTSALAARFGVIVIEDLNIVGMLRNRRLARVISDAG
ncbi:IS607 family element RNA-guided endonuclease TnpB [Nocardia sp. SYP-A9097]|uniref:IS607 family element RNA-guided endonuclease TnpB n=1 Tax=Nocardia sp. SYP-A9097 TaxID=2663237 RepID=UPI0035C92D83